MKKAKTLIFAFTIFPALLSIFSVELTYSDLADG